jgi:Fe-S cluster assembly ATP-binding protein
LFFNRKNITNLFPEKRAKLGLFLAFQHSLEFEGLNFLSFLNSSLSKVKRKRIDILKSKKEMLSNLKKVGMQAEFAERYLNYGFSGGEKKKSEILQLLTLKPKFAVLDEIDSGLDIDSLKRVSGAISDLKNRFKTSFLVITHISRIAKYLKPDFVHIMIEGKIVKSGDKKLIKQIEKYGFKNFRQKK